MALGSIPPEKPESWEPIFRRFLLERRSALADGTYLLENVAYGVQFPDRSAAVRVILGGAWSFATAESVHSAISILLQDNQADLVWLDAGDVNSPEFGKDLDGHDSAVPQPR